MPTLYIYDKKEFEELHSGLREEGSLDAIESFTAINKATCEYWKNKNHYNNDNLYISTYHKLS